MIDDRPPITPRSPRAALEPEQVPQPPKRSKGARNSWVIVGNAIFTLLLLLMIGAGGAYVYGKKLIETPGPLADDKTIVIPTRAGRGDIADILIREGVIADNRWAFFAGTLAFGASLKSGEYLIPKHASLRDVIDTMVEGKVVQHSLTVAEGLTSEQIVARLMENDILSGDIKEIPREGTLLPETYKFPRGTTRDQVIQRMQAAQKRVLQEVWDHRNADIPEKTPEQLLTMASIVEKETGRADERSRVAAVFVNRLRSNMKLQSDPTIIYGLVGGKGSLGRPIRQSEIRQPTPYNTYVINGLPPGPISNPGRASLEAAANPARTRDLYFVADGTGGHAFADTLDQHQKNVAKWRALEKGPTNDSSDQAEVVPAAANTPAAPAPTPPAAAAKSAPAKQPAAPKRQTSNPRPAAAAQQAPDADPDTQ